MSFTGRLPILSLLAGLRGRLATRRARRAERLAFATLLRAPAHRLADLGIDAVDVREALESASRRGSRSD